MKPATALALALAALALAGMIGWGLDQMAAAAAAAIGRALAN